MLAASSLRTIGKPSSITESQDEVSAFLLMKSYYKIFEHCKAELVQNGEKCLAKQTRGNSVQNVFL